MKSILNKKKYSHEPEKKGQGGLSITTLVVIIVAVVVLVFLIFGFTTGWSNLWGTISGIFGSGSNVDNHVTGCEIACSANDEFSYCGELRDVDFGSGSLSNLNGEYNCRALEDIDETGLDSCGQFQGCSPIQEVYEEEEYVVNCAEVANFVNEQVFCGAVSDIKGDPNSDSDDKCQTVQGSGTFMKVVSNDNIENDVDDQKAEDLGRSKNRYEWKISSAGISSGEVCCLMYNPC